MKRPVACAWCNKISYHEAGAINRARAANCYLYCGRVCSGLGRRKNKSGAQKKAEKAEYDRLNRERNRERFRAEKAARHKRTYDPVKAAVERKQNMPRHVEYCRRPEYRAKKTRYDLERRAKEFGDFNESYQLLHDLEKEVLSRASRYEIYQANGTLNKALQRRRAYDQAYSREP